MKKLIVVDTETGGLDPTRHSIVSFGAVIYQDGSISGEFYTLVAEHPFICTDEARKIHGITPLGLADAPTPWAAVQKFKQWLLKNEMYGQQTLVGHKAEFDAAFLRRLWTLAGEDFEEQFGHRYLCTQSAALLLDTAGRINLPGGNASLDSLCKMFNVGVQGDVHNALTDAKLAARVLAKLVEKVK